MVRIETEKGLKNNSKSQYIQHPVFGKQDREGASSHHPGRNFQWAVFTVCSEHDCATEQIPGPEIGIQMEWKKKQKRKKNSSKLSYLIYV